MKLCPRRQRNFASLGMRGDKADARPARRQKSKLAIEMRRRKRHRDVAFSNINIDADTADTVPFIERRRLFTIDVTDSTLLENARRAFAYVCLYRFDYLSCITDFSSSI